MPAKELFSKLSVMGSNAEMCSRVGDKGSPRQLTGKACCEHCIAETIAVLSSLLVMMGRKTVFEKFMVRPVALAKESRISFSFCAVATSALAGIRVSSAYCNVTGGKEWTTGWQRQFLLEGRLNHSLQDVNENYEEIGDNGSPCLRPL